MIKEISNSPKVKINSHLIFHSYIQNRLCAYLIPDSEMKMALKIMESKKAIITMFFFNYNYPYISYSHFEICNFKKYYGFESIALEKSAINLYLSKRNEFSILCGNWKYIVPFVKTIYKHRL